MKRNLSYLRLASFILVLFFSIHLQAQDLEWRLANPTFSSTDPDGAGPATGVATFTLQIHAIAGSIPNITGMSTGWCWQSSRAMLPTAGPVVPTCGTPSIQQPSNITMSSELDALGFRYNYVDQCSGSVNITAGGETFDRRASGTVDGGIMTLTTSWVNVFTVTLWTRGSSNPRGGYVVINSGARDGATDVTVFSTYAVSDLSANQFVVNTLTWGAPLALGSSILPVRLTKFDAQCLPNKTALISWSTAEEINSSHFEVEKSENGIEWKSVGRVNSSGNSSSPRNYEYNDLQGGSAQYRLKQVDIDGQLRYSATARTSCDNRNVYVNLYPVPARDFVNLVVGANSAVKTNIQVFDNKGKLVINMPVTLTSGQNSFRINVHHLATGEYYLRSTDSGIEINKKFTVVR